MKKVPLHSRERLRKSAKENDVVTFVKEVALHPRESLRKSAIENDGIAFVKKFSLHQLERLIKSTKENMMTTLFLKKNLLYVLVKDCK